MKFLFAGNYLPDYNRTAIIKKGLLQLGHKVSDYPFEKKSSLVKNDLIQLSKDVDWVFLPSFTHKEVKYVKSVLPKHPIAFDPLISRYLTKVYDYKLVSPYGISALRNFFRDKTPMNIADIVFTDTEAHKQYFYKTFKIPLNKMHTLYIGNDFDKFYPIDHKKESTIFKVGFYGGFIPLQGVMNILEASRILQNHSDIQFELIGNGFEYEKAKKFVAQHKLDNVIMPGWLKEEELHKKINSFDLCLGIFGETKKSDLVIPNKVYHYAACAKNILSKDSPAIREIFNQNENIYLCDTNPKKIANQILKIQTETDEKGQNAYKLIRSNYSAENIARNFLSALSK